MTDNKNDALYHMNIANLCLLIYSTIASLVGLLAPSLPDWVWIVSISIGIALILITVILMIRLLLTH